MKRLIQNRRTLDAVVVLLGLVAAMSLFGNASPALARDVTQDLILLTAVVGYYVFVGNSGVLSFGHVGFMAVGGYTAGVLSISPGERKLVLPGFPSVLDLPQFTPYSACLIGGAVSAALAALLAVPLMRLSGIAAALTSFAVLQVVYVVVGHADSITGGAGGLSGIPATVGIIPALLTALVVIVAAFAFQCTRWGVRLRASREDAVAASALGIHVHRQRGIAFVISAFIIGIAGGLYAEFLGGLTPDTLYLTVTFLLIAMLVTGGEKSLSGAVIGSVIVSAVNEVLDRVEQGFNIGSLHIKGPLGISQIGLAVILLLVLIVRPSGITGGQEIAAIHWLRRVTRRARKDSSHTQPDEPDRPPRHADELTFERD